MFAVRIPHATLYSQMKQRTLSKPVNPFMMLLVGENTADIRHQDVCGFLLVSFL